MINRKVLIFISIFFLAVGLNVSTYATDTDLTLDTSDSSSAFNVKNSSGNTILRARGDGNVGIGKNPNPGINLHVFKPTSGDALVQIQSDVAGGDALLRFNKGGATPWDIGYVDTNFRFIYRSGPNIDAMTLKSNGNVGIGTTSPDEKLHVAGNIRLNDTEIYIRPSGDKNHGLGWYGLGKLWLGQNIDGPVLYGNSGGALGIANLHTPTQTVLVWRDTGNVGIGTGSPNFKLDVRGTIGDNTTTYHSDIRWKRNISTLTDALDKVTALRGVNFEWREDEFPEMAFSKGKKLGFVAQEVEEFLPEVVDIGADGYKSVQYANIVPLLVEAIKELKGENDALKQDIKEVKAENSQLKEKLLALGARQEAIEAIVFGGTGNENERLSKLDDKLKTVK